MAPYKVNHEYESSLGVLTEGTVVELTDEEAEAFNRDSPGVVSKGKAAAKGKVRMVPEAPRDRMRTRPRRDRVAGGAMTTAFGMGKGQREADAANVQKAAAEPEPSSIPEPDRKTAVKKPRKRAAAKTRKTTRKSTRKAAAKKKA